MSSAQLKRRHQEESDRSPIMAQRAMLDDLEMPYGVRQSEDVSAFSDGDIEQCAASPPRETIDRRRLLSSRLCPRKKRSKDAR